MLKSASNFVFINESPTANARTSANKKAVKAHAARFPRVALGDQQVQATTRSAARWNRYQKARRNRQPLLSVNLTVDALQPQPSQDNDASTNTSVNVTESTGEGTSQEDPSPVEDISSHSSSAQLISPSMPGGGWAAPFKPQQSQGKPFKKLLVDHCKMQQPSDLSSANT